MGPNKNNQKWPITGDKQNIHEELREGLTCGRRIPLHGKQTVRASSRSGNIAVSLA